MLHAKANHGFTLFEILLALTITIILIVIAVPTLTYFSQDHRLAANTQSLYYVLQTARSEAVKRNQTVYVSFQTGSNWCYGINVGSTCTCSIANNCGLGTYTAPSRQDMALSGTGLTNNSISFEGTRGAANASSLLTFTLNGQSTAISVSVTALGNMQMCSAQVSGYPTCS